MAQTIGTSNKVDVWADDGTVVEPASSKVDVGWQLGEQPPHEFMNWLQNTFGQKLNHALQHGVARWNDATEYGVGDFVTHNDQLYRAANVNTNSEPPSGNWQTYEVQESATDTGPGLLARAEFQRNLREIVVMPYDVNPGDLPSGFTKDSAGQVTWDTTAFPWLKFVIVDLYGAGGGGGGSNNTNFRCGQGGAGGGFSRKLIRINELTSTIVLTIGQGGSAGSTTIDNAGNGGTTSFSSIFSATGGGAGKLGGTNGTVGNNSVGTGVGGSENIRGEAGGPSSRTSSLDGSTFPCQQSVGGKAAGPMGGMGGFYPGAGFSGRDGDSPGGGGSGGNRIDSNNSGGNGGDGQAILYLFG